MLCKNNNIFSHKMRFPFGEWKAASFHYAAASGFYMLQVLQAAAAYS